MPRHELHRDGRLEHGQALGSRNGLYRFINQSDGNLVVYDQDDKPIWASNTNGKGQGHLVYQSDGNLVLYHGSTPLWASNTNGRSTGRLDMQNDGNLVIYDGENRPVWATNTNREFKGHHDTLRVGRLLDGDHELRSRNGKYRAVMQGDGNFVLYDEHNKPLWASGTNGKGHGIHLQNQYDGNLVLYDRENRAVWATGTNGKSNSQHLIVQDDGNLVLYNGSAPIWATNTNR